MIRFSERGTSTQTNEKQRNTKEIGERKREREDVQRILSERGTTPLYYRRQDTARNTKPGKYMDCF